ncbi:hypothetical protein BH10ACT7_BH10ACT7_06110 [soil metagenome]
MKVQATVSHGDWFNAWGSWGKPSVERILAELRDAGIKQVPWRTMFGGRAQYSSQHEDVYHGSERGTGIDRPGNEGSARRAYDLRTWDPLRDAVEVAHGMGLEIGAWYPLFEESHFQLDVSRFSRDHEASWASTRDGRARRSKLSFADPEVVSHKLAVLGEQLDYGVDFVMLDFYRETQEWSERHRPSVEVDEDGVSVFGYDDATLTAFQRESGLDATTLTNAHPAWVDFRVRVMDDFATRAAELVHARGLKMGVRVRSLRSMRLPLPWWETEEYDTDSRRGSFVDWAAWARGGVVDDVVLFMDNWDLFDLDARTVWAEARDARSRIGPDATLTMGLFVFDMVGRSTTEGENQLEILADAARRGGADGICLLESNNVHAWGGGIGGGGRAIGLWDAVRRISSEGWAGRHI